MNRRIAVTMVGALSVMGLAGCGGDTSAEPPATTTVAPFMDRVNTCSEAANSAKDAVVAYLRIGPKAVASSSTPELAAQKIRDAAAEPRALIEQARSVCALPECPDTETATLDYMAQLVDANEDTANALDRSPSNGVTMPAGEMPDPKACPRPLGQ
jgi:hypothetical protein